MLGKRVLQIQVDFFHAVAVTAEHGEDYQDYLVVLITYLALRSSIWESIIEERMPSNLSKMKNISPKMVFFSDFMLTFAMSLMILLILICSTIVSENSDMTKS